MSVYCQILVDGQMEARASVPIVHEFASAPRIDEKIVIVTDNGPKTFHVDNVTNFARDVDGEAQILLAVSGIP